MKCEVCSSTERVERFVVSRRRLGWVTQILHACAFCRFGVKLRRALERA